MTVCKTKPFFLIFSMLASLVGFLSAEAPSKPRIAELIPSTWIEYPAIEPAIPSDYELFPFQNSTYALWGKKEDLKSVAASKEDSPMPSVGAGVFSLRHTDVIQTGPETFSFDEEMMRTFLVNNHAKNIVLSKTKWGDYPVIYFSAEVQPNYIARSAWIGLNSPNGHVLFAQLIPSGNVTEDESLWANFISNTTKLTAREFLLANGMDMEVGQTCYSAHDANITVLAEKRIEDDTMAILIKPNSPKTSMEVVKIEEGAMGMKWKYGEPCIKVYGAIANDGDHGKIVIDTVITVLTKAVDTFSFDLNKDSHPDNVLLFVNTASE